MSGFDLNYWIGFFLSAVIFSIFFYGISIAQTLYYYRHYPEDSRLLKAYVLGLLMLDFGRTVLDVAIIWFWTIEHHGDVGFLLICPPSFATEFLFSKLTIIAVQGFFINTIWRRMWLWPLPYGKALLTRCCSSGRQPIPPCVHTVGGCIGIIGLLMWYSTNGEHVRRDLRLHNYPEQLGIWSARTGRVVCRRYLYHRCLVHGTT